METKQTIANEKTFISKDNVLGIRTTNLECINKLQKDKYFDLRETCSLPDNVIKQEGVTKAKFNKVYLLEVLKLLKKIKDDKVTIYLKDNYPVIIETSSTCSIIAPIVEVE